MTIRSPKTRNWLRKSAGLICMLSVLALVLFWPSYQSGLSAQAGHNITLTWAAPSSGAAAVTYNVKRGTTSGNEATIGTTTAPTTTYVDSTGVAGTKYFYVVTAVNPQASPTESAPSNEASATFLPLAAPGTPGSLGVVAN